MIELIKKSVLAAVLIALGDFVLLKIGAPIGAFLFAFGLFGVCKLGANLFTGKCGFVIRDKKWLDLGIILLVNLIAGFTIGAAMGLADPSLEDAALSKIESWDLSISLFLRSVFCGMIMYIAVRAYKKDSVWGIFFGVPLFILAGFQHSIANIITAGVALSFSPTVLLCAAGNFVGSVCIAWLEGPEKDSKASKASKKK